MPDGLGFLVELSHKILAIQRLLAHRSIKGECWLWTGPTNGKPGYGVIKIRPIFGAKQPTIHRVAAWAFLKFDLDSVKCVCHKCDTKLCFNPDHLFIGTVQDNLLDMRLKKRNSTHRKLTKDQVRQIVLSQESGVILAKRFKTHTSTVSNIRNGKAYKEFR